MSCSYCYNDIIISLLDSHRYSIWVGATQGDGEEGQQGWTWADGLTPVPQEAWAAGEPDGSGGYAWINTYYSDGLLRDISCTRQNSPLCQGMCIAAALIVYLIVTHNTDPQQLTMLTLLTPPQHIHIHAL